MNSDNCQQIRLILIECIEQERSVDGRVELDRHLSNCDACRSFADEVTVILTDLAEMRELSRLSAASIAGDNPSGKIVYRLKWLAGVAAMLVLTGVLWQTLRQTNKTFVNDATVVQVETDHVAPSIRLEGASTERFLVIEKPAKTAKVNVIWLHERYTGVTEASEDLDSERGAMEVVSDLRVG